ncbi:MAG: hypothetical protein EPN73_23300 [Paraburkholderia sp.]|uniref:hypothetical protein n=1 Tax=Paraburkholderia sp. TaxID=1926495 RepID=UPI00120E185B|nr:hypothetical protein [Paraburkholderia sp.]TAL92909.1 MAG: hypothetical protein EPN73_23300 [Paraburkholderia sp.]
MKKEDMVVKDDEQLAMIGFIAGRTALREAFFDVSLATGYIYAMEVLAVAGLRRFSGPQLEKRHLADPAILSCAGAKQVRGRYRREVQPARRRGHTTPPPMQSDIPRPLRRS